MQKKTWTILICAYNCEDTIADTLNSIIYDGNDDLDVMVVDDGSTQDIYKIVQPFVTKYPNIVHYFKKENGNQGSCINFAIKKADSRYLSLLDSDDTFRTADFQKVLDLLRKSKENTDLVVLNFDMLFVNKKIKKAIRSKNSKTLRNIQYKPFSKMSMFEISTIHSSIYSLDLLKRIDPIPEKVGYSDNILYYEVLLRANNIAFLNKKIHLYQYFIRGEKQAIYMKSCINNFKDIMTIYDRMLNTDLSRFDKDRVRVAKKIIGNHIYWIMAILGNDYNRSKQEKSTLIQYVYVKLRQFEKQYNCNITPGIVKMMGKNKYGGIFFVKFLYKFIPVKFVKATRYTKQGKIELKQILKEMKKNKKQA